MSNEAAKRCLSLTNAVAKIGDIPYTIESFTNKNLSACAAAFVNYVQAVSDAITKGEDLKQFVLTVDPLDALRDAINSGMGIRKAALVYIDATQPQDEGWHLGPFTTCPSPLNNYHPTILIEADLGGEIGRVNIALSKINWRMVRKWRYIGGKR